MWLLFLFVLMRNALLSAGELVGDNVCQKQEVYTVSMRVLVKEPVTITVYTWCMKIPPRCAKEKVVLRDKYKTVNEPRMRIVNVCCDGYAPVKDGTRCVPICTCLHGRCESPGKCVCEPGYTGDKCDTVCPAGFYGRDCKEECRCKNDASCHHVDGVCHCNDGWSGTLCDVPCPSGTYGKNCLLECDCDENEVCHPVNGTCLTTVQYMDDNLYETIVDTHFIDNTTSQNGKLKLTEETSINEHPASAPNSVTDAPNEPDSSLQSMNSATPTQENIGDETTDTYNMVFTRKMSNDSILLKHLTRDSGSTTVPTSDMTDVKSDFVSMRSPHIESGIVHVPSFTKHSSDDHISTRGFNNNSHFTTGSPINPVVLNNKQLHSTKREEKYNANIKTVPIINTTRFVPMISSESAKEEFNEIQVVHPDTESTSTTPPTTATFPSISNSSNITNPSVFETTTNLQSFTTTTEVPEEGNTLEKSVTEDLPESEEDINKNIIDHEQLTQILETPANVKEQPVAKVGTVFGDISDLVFSVCVAAGVAIILIVVAIAIVVVAHRQRLKKTLMVNRVPKREETLGMSIYSGSSVYSNDDNTIFPERDIHARYVFTGPNITSSEEYCCDKIQNPSTFGRKDSMTSHYDIPPPARCSFSRSEVTEPIYEEIPGWGARTTTFLTFNNHQDTTGA